MCLFLVYKRLFNYDFHSFSLLPTLTAVRPFWRLQKPTHIGMPQHDIYRKVQKSILIDSLALTSTGILTHKLQKYIFFSIHQVNFAIPRPANSIQHTLSIVYDYFLTLLPLVALRAVALPFSFFRPLAWIPASHTAFWTVLDWSHPRRIPFVSPSHPLRISFVYASCRHGAFTRRDGRRGGGDLFLCTGHTKKDVCALAMGVE